ncbi:MAG: hypothetical protein AVDCRST_MAG26-4083, partial [uncultured Chloroflexia bacterium]
GVEHARGLVLRAVHGERPRTWRVRLVAVHTSESSGRACRGRQHSRL